MFVGQVYTLTAADGSIAVFNSASDPNFVGYLTEISGLDSAEVRASGEDKAEDDGGTNGNAYFGRRPIVFEGIIPQASELIRTGRIDKLEQVLNSAMRADAALTWTPADTIARRVLVRRNMPKRITGLVDKRFTFGVISASHLIESNVAVVTNDAAAPLSQVVTNSGNAKALPVIRITGAATSPITLTVGGVTVLRWSSSLAGTGDWVEFDFARKTAKLNTGVSVYQYLDFALTTWDGLKPGANTVASDKGTAMTITHRHSWT